MKIFEDLFKWQAFRRDLKPRSLGFVPTMGNLHQGHLSLIEQSCRHHEMTVVSLFVNPKQFDNPNDFTHYPKTLEADLNLLRAAKVDFCLLPSAEAMYADQFRYQVTENHFSQKLEGAHRPGHFTGVLTVVMKLLNLVNPDGVYFGEKDYQQYQLIRDMALAFFMPVQVILCKTIREDSGLAYSSRHNRLTKDQLAIAHRFAQIFHQNKAIEETEKALEEEGLIMDYLIDYERRRYVAVKLGEIRLIDNYEL